jgi:predicted cupin superfamily sugar epimerase
VDLIPHPEGGWYAETWRSDVMVQTPAGPRPSATAILFRLNRGEESRWHRVRSAELWLWHRGGPLDLTLGGPGERPVPEPSLRLHPGNPQLVVPPGVWQTARPAGDDGVLVSCVVSPGFDFADFELL